MMPFSLWKQLRKRLRRRGQLALGGIALFLSAALLAGGPIAHAGEPAPSLAEKLRSADGPLPVTLHRMYICGEETKELGRMDPDAIVKLMMEHPEWTAVLSRSGDAVVMEQRIEELSELCRSDMYIGIDRNGNLSLFEGLPKKEKVMRTFFQLDVNYLESSLPEEKLEQLIGGIKITDMDEYNSVLSTFSDFAVQKKRKTY